MFEIINLFFVQNYMNVNHQKLLTDVELETKILPNINNTITIFGKQYMRTIFNTIKNSTEIIEHELEIKKFINNKSIKKVIHHLKQIKKNQTYVNEILNDNNNIENKDQELSHDYKDLIFKKELFNQQSLLSISNFIKIYSPSFVIIIYLVIYLFYRYIGINLNIKEYLYSIYTQWQSAVELILHLISSYEHFNSFLANIVVTSYLAFQLYTMASSFNNSYQHYNKCAILKKNVNKINMIIYESDKIINLCKFSNKSQCIIPIIQQLKNLFDPHKINNLGYCILKRKDITNYLELFNKLFEYIGYIDTMIVIENLLKNKYTIPIFDFQSDRPYVKSTNIWNPQYKGFQISNDWEKIIKII